MKGNRSYQKEIRMEPEADLTVVGGCSWLLNTSFTGMLCIYVLMSLAPLFGA